ncbi:hypothetical protein NECAME_11876 [Necator americanus]|uniref:Uncharacterized protein n=1 Tax=Necator americanus TaxID=51031 RepID=W2T3K6_NECAM|nr:hypothetical protein NECAME_11876 [Necator americanus]ETN76139.1 hypothetical protein NECAME_11876 [Necator americanus]
MPYKALERSDFALETAFLASLFAARFWYSIKVNIDQHDLTKDSFIYESMDESSIARRDISLMVNYVNAADQQPESNLVREELVEELKNRILDVQQR